MHRLTEEKRVQVVSCLVEGSSIRATVRMTGAAKNTVVKLLTDLGKACSEYQSRVLRDLSCKRIQCDEIWSFVYARDKNVPDEKKGTFGYGDVWTWTAICSDTKLVPCWHVGTRDAEAAHTFMMNLAGRLKHRVQLTTDGHKSYLEAVEGSFGSEIDYAMLVKIYGENGEGEQGRRYSAAKCIEIRKVIVNGVPEEEHISTSFVERQNLTMRMGIRRFTRLTNAFSKKVENHEAAVSLHFMYYNFSRVHQTLRVTPAMEAGITDHIWSLEEIVSLLDQKSN